MESCIAEIRVRICSNFLKLNGEKAEVIIFGSTQQLRKVEIESLYIGDTLVIPSYNVCNLGVHLGKHVTMEEHVTSVSRAAIFLLRKKTKIRRYLIPMQCSR